jgi:ERCC4-related helicase
MQEQLDEGAIVGHGRFGTGTVRVDLGLTAIVRFAHGVEECKKSDLQTRRPIASRVRNASWDLPLEVINRVQAESIISINNSWGVFARSRIELLPHQLWVCREVNKEWPTRWLVADDVGLGKTIEAGLILTPLLTSGRVARLLILCPASLVEQWQQRLRTMFDIRLAIYTPEADTPRTDFWHTHAQVIVSLHTLRADHRGRHERLLDSDPWDLVLVDESHHINADEKAGPTLAHQLIKKLTDHNKVQSMVFFTGTPHRGKTFGFLAQLQLLRPDLFDPRKPLREQLVHLRDVVIRNNKYNVTDLKGDRLFREPHVDMATYSYSEIEQLFYDTLTEFILKGRAYAAKLSQSDASAVMLVLIAMQKLASSSVAAIRRAIRGRLQRITDGRKKVGKLSQRLADYRNLLDEDAGDAVASAEEELARISSALVLMEDEEAALRNLLAIADRVESETKIARLLEIVAEKLQHRAVLFFTEYKATQSLLMSALLQQFGPGCVSFINGDGRADGVQMPDGTTQSIRKPRDVAADEFNSAKVRFLVSTEAAGEGIDLQENCYTLIHVDLPWNPMRLHQRVGRLNRYGQRKRVEVLSIRNPDTVEARIWGKLDEKLDRINEAFAHVMDTPEDLKQLVLGMTSSQMFQRLFAESVSTPVQKLDSWFDQHTASFGGQDAVEVVEALVGAVHRFDFRQVSNRIPKVDLPDLRPFFEAALTLNGRRVSGTDTGISFITPDAWRDSPAVRTKYENMGFDRLEPSARDTQRLLGVGHKAVDQALAQARERDVMVGAVPVELLSEPIVVMHVHDRVTDGPLKPSVLFAVCPSGESQALQIAQDWEVLKRLNEIPRRKEILRDPSPPANAEDVLAMIEKAHDAISAQLDELVPRFAVPECQTIAVLWPL